MYIFDTPYLIKAMLNNLLKYNLKFYDKFASWRYIVQFYPKNTKQWIKATPKLSSIHIEYNNFSKMKVKYAVQVLSNHVATSMCTLMSVGYLPSETIEFIDRFDKLFDILNSSFTVSPKEYRKVFIRSTKQLEFLQEIGSIETVDNRDHSQSEPWSILTWPTGATHLLWIELRYRLNSIRRLLMSFCSTIFLVHSYLS